MSQPNHMPSKDLSVGLDLLQTNTNQKFHQQSSIECKEGETNLIGLNQQHDIQGRAMQDNTATQEDKAIDSNQNIANGSKLILIKNRAKKTPLTQDQNICLINQTHSRINLIQKQKRSLIKQLKRLNQSIAQINCQTEKQRKQKLLIENIALKKARQTVNKFKLQKAKQQKKKRQIFQSSLQWIKQENQRSKKQREAKQAQIRQQKLKNIQQRLKQQEQKQQQRVQKQQVEKQSNILVAKINKQNASLKKLSVFQVKDIEIHDSPQISCKRVLDLKQIQQHQKKYLKDKSEQHKKPIKISHPIRKYHKNIWAYKLQQEAFKQNELTKQKEQQKKQLLQRKIKYSQIISKAYSPARLKTSASQYTSPPNLSSKQLTKQALSLPRRSKGNSAQQFKSIYRYSLKHNKDKRQQTFAQSSKQKQRRIQLRRQTQHRLIKFQNHSVYCITKPSCKPKQKFQNYLSQGNRRTRSSLESMYKVLQNPQISRQQKYKKMITLANQMEQKAKLMQEVIRKGDQTSNDLYVKSIEAKIALLQQL